MKHKLLLAGLMLLLGLSGFAQQSGKIGPDATWSYNADTHEFRISGQGTTFDGSYSYNGMIIKSPDRKGVSKAPSEEPYGAISFQYGAAKEGDAYTFDPKEVKSIVIEEGITSIGDWTFAFFYNAQSVTLPNTLVKIGGGAFLKDTCLTEITIPEGVTNMQPGTCYSSSSMYGSNITYGIFSGCTHLTTVYWNAKGSEYGITSPLMGLEKTLKTLEMGNKVEYIPEKFCKGLITLESVELGKNIKSIGYAAFNGCRNLKNVTLLADSMLVLSQSTQSEVISTIKSYYQSSPFAQCGDTLEVFIGKEVKYIGEFLFSSYEKYNRNELGYTLAPSIGYRESYLKNIKLTFEEGSQLKMIDSYAFAGVNGLETFSIPSSVETIRQCAFYKTDITTVRIGNGLKSIAGNAFGSCPKLANVYYNARNTTLEFEYRIVSERGGNDPDPYYSYYYESPFLNGADSMTITIGRDVEYIPAYMFMGGHRRERFQKYSNNGKWYYTDVIEPRTDIKKVIIEEGCRLKVIDSYAFAGCTNLREFDLQQTPFVTEIHGFAFAQTGLNKVYIGEDVSVVKPRAFDKCLLDTVWFNARNCVETITEAYGTGTYESTYTLYKDSPFSNGSDYTVFFIGDNVTNIPPFTFCKYKAYKGQNSTSWSIQNYQSYINQYTIHFSPATNVRIGEYAFAGNQTWTKLTIPSKVTKIGDNAFERCTNLVDVQIHDSQSFGTTDIGDYIFQYCNSLTNMEWNVKRCHDFSKAAASPLYNRAKYIESVKFGDNVEYIPNGMCANMEYLDEITIPENVKSIGDSAFFYCMSVDTFRVYPSAPPTVGYNAFPSKAKMKVKCDAKEKYIADTQWGKYKIMTECIGDTPDDDEPDTPEIPETPVFFPKNNYYSEARYMAHASGYSDGDWFLRIYDEDTYLGYFDVNTGFDNKIAGTHQVGTSYPSAYKYDDNNTLLITGGTIEVTLIGDTTIAGYDHKLPLYEYKMTGLVIGEYTVSRTIHVAVLAYDYQYYQDGNSNWLITLADEKTQTPDEPDTPDTPETPDNPNEPETPVFFPKNNYYSEAMYMGNASKFNDGDWYLQIMDENGTRSIAYFDVNTGSDNKIAGTHQVGTPYASVYYYDTDNTLKITGGTLEITLIGDTLVQVEDNTITLPLYEYKVTDLIINGYTVSKTMHVAVLAYDYQALQNGSIQFITLADEKTLTPDEPDEPGNDEPDAPASDNCFDMNQLGDWSVFRCINYDFGVVNDGYSEASYYTWNPSLSPDNHPRQTLITRQGKDKICRQLDVLTPDKRASIRLAADTYAPTDSAKGAVIVCYFDVTEDNSIVKLQYAAVMHTPEHTIVTQDGFKDFAQPHIHIDVLDVSSGTTTINTYSISHYPSDASTIQGWTKGKDADGNDLIWKDWSSVTYDFSAYIGKRLAIMLTTYDCAESGYDSQERQLEICKQRHQARLYFSLSCGSSSDTPETPQDDDTPKTATIYQDCALNSIQGQPASRALEGLKFTRATVSCSYDQTTHRPTEVVSDTFAIVSEAGKNLYGCVIPGTLYLYSEGFGYDDNGYLSGTKTGYIMSVPGYFLYTDGGMNPGLKDADGNPLFSSESDYMVFAEDTWQTDGKKNGFSLEAGRMTDEAAYISHIKAAISALGKEDYSSFSNELYNASGSLSGGVIWEYTYNDEYQQYYTTYLPAALVSDLTVTLEGSTSSKYMSDINGLSATIRPFGATDYKGTTLYFGVTTRKDENGNIVVSSQSVEFEPEITYNTASSAPARSKEMPAFDADAFRQMLREQSNMPELPKGRMAMPQNSGRLNAPATDKVAVIVSSDGCDSHTSVYAAEGETVTVNAIAKDGWKFDKWSDGSTGNPYEFTATKGMTLVAYFRQNDAGESNNISVTPDTNTADFVWKTINEASTYELTISDKQGNTICVLTFNAYGQLLSIAFSAPARHNATEPIPTDGFFFTVTGLDEGTTYNYTLTAKDIDGNTLDIKEGTFKTKGVATNLEDMSGDSDNSEIHKVFLNGVLYILMPDGRMYDMQGKEVR